MKKYFLEAHRILTKVYSDGTYSNMAFYGSDTKDMTTKLVYGVLETDVRSEYIISALVDKTPQRAVKLMLKIGIYALENLTDVPDFAIVSECVEATKAIGKGGASGFVNAVLKKVAKKQYPLPAEDNKIYLSVTYSKPQWFVDKLIKQYGKDIAIDILSAQSDHLEHIRVNTRRGDMDKVISELKRANESYTLSEVGGIIARGTATVKRMFDDGLVTYQSTSSMLAVQALEVGECDSVLDLCSAPGGKAVYISELCPKGKVTACELHPHRVSLIEKYKKRMRAVGVVAAQYDATKLNEKWINAFDRVLVDVPCSCFGTFLKHPDVFLSREEADIAKLSATQKQILSNAAQYVKKDGVLVYSTCTLFDEENGAVVNSLLDKGGFALEKITAAEVIDSGKYKDNTGSIQILPHGEYDGFYIARLRKL